MNNQNYQVLGTENTQVFVEKKIYPLGMTVWSAYWAEGVICHFLFEDVKEATIIDNEDQYYGLFRKILILTKQCLVPTRWSSTCPSSLETIALLIEKFSDRVI